MNARVSLLATTLSLLLVFSRQLPPDQHDSRTKRYADPQGGFHGRGPPSRRTSTGDADYRGPPGQNGFRGRQQVNFESRQSSVESNEYYESTTRSSFEVQPDSLDRLDLSSQPEYSRSRSPSGPGLVADGPPGLSGGGPPGHSGRGPPGHSGGGPPGHANRGNSGPPGLGGGKPPGWKAKPNKNDRRPPGEDDRGVITNIRDQNYDGNGVSTNRGQNYDRDGVSPNRGQNTGGNEFSTNRGQNYDRDGLSANRDQNYGGDGVSTNRGQTDNRDGVSNNRGSNYGGDGLPANRGQSDNRDGLSANRGQDYGGDGFSTNRGQSGNGGGVSTNRGQNYGGDGLSTNRGQSDNRDGISANRGQNYGGDGLSTNRGQSYGGDGLSTNRGQNDNRDGLSTNRGQNYGGDGLSTNRGENDNRDGFSTNRGQSDDANVYYPDRNRNGGDTSAERCRSTEFRCRSGECLSTSVRCDGRSDCRDSSDEDNCSSATNSEGGCILPDQLDGGNYELGGCDAPCRKHPGDKVPRNSVLTYTCSEGYVLQGNTISACVNDKWYDPPTCLKTCHPISSTSVELRCTHHGKPVSCSEPAKPGTRATLACKQSYKLPLTNDPGYREINCVENGSWDRTVFRCLPECGTVVSHGNTLIVHGFKAKVGVFPWHVGIYSKNSKGEYEQICGGTLISSNLVISAAHCFYDEVYEKVHDASNYAVASGKHYRRWLAKENYAQKSAVEKIEVADRYIGARGNFAEDIALVKLKSPFELTALVRPICMDWDNVYERDHLQVGQSGKAVGWGKTEDGEASETLQEINLPYVSYDQCQSAVPTEFRGYLTFDKFCAGYQNGSSLCDGDSGGGLCFQKDGVWYIRGVVSVSPVNQGHCDYNSYVGFTNIGRFIDWIRTAYVTS